MTQEQRVELWDAINDYAVACGGTPSAFVYGNTARQVAVADVERVVSNIEADAAPSQEPSE